MPSRLNKRQLLAEEIAWTDTKIFAVVILRFAPLRVKKAAREILRMVASSQIEKWQPDRYSLVSLLQMLEFHAKLFTETITELSRLHGILHHPIQSDPIGVYQHVKKVLGEVSKQCEIVQIDAIDQQIARILEPESGFAARMPTLQGAIKELLNRIVDKLDDRKFLYIPIDEVGYFKGLDFGGLVSTQFPELLEDISEGSKCIALARYTAAAFHLLRVAESGVKYFGNELRVTLTPGATWGDYLKEINKVISAIKVTTPEDQQKKEDLQELSVHLGHVKNAFRNPTMHPKKTYTEDEAVAVWNMVGTFMRRLVELFPKAP